jgi:16S rRNA (cytosine1402-N4)-methyltransferase
VSGHIPVLRDEAIAAAAVTAGEIAVDATFGGGGYTAELLKAGARVYAFDRDPAAIAAGQARFGDEARLTLIEAPFDEMEEALGTTGVEHVDAIVFDFGVSSMQLDQAERGFSFMADGPLDMRMGQGRSAAEFVNEADPRDLADVIYQYGEDRRSRALARAIVAEREKVPFETTGQLAALAERTLGKTGRIHPATRLFQALRILVNDELGQIVRALIAAERLLREGGRLVAVAFHSLEDRIVKRFLAATTGRSDTPSRHEPQRAGDPATFLPKLLNTKPTAEESAANPRARSARLRAATRNDVPAADWTESRLRQLGVPPLVFSSVQETWGSA